MSDKHLNVNGTRRKRADSKVSNLTMKFRKQQDRILRKTARMVENYTLG